MGRRFCVFVWVSVVLCGCGKPPATPDDPGAKTTRRGNQAPPNAPPEQVVPGAQKPDPDEPYGFREIPLPKGIRSAIAFSADSKLMALGGGGGIYVLTVPEGKEVIRMQIPDTKNRMKLAFASDGHHLISVNSPESLPDGWRHGQLGTETVRYWNLETGQKVKERDLPRVKDAYGMTGFSPDAKRVAMNVADGITIIDLETFDVVAKFTTGRGFPLHGAFSPDGTRFAAGTGSGQLAVWEVATGKQVAISPPARGRGEGEFTPLVYSPDGCMIATGNTMHSGGPGQVWDAKTCELLGEVGRGTHAPHFTWGLGSTALIGYHTAPGDRESKMCAVDITSGRVLYKFLPRGQAWWSPSTKATTPDGRYVAFFDSIIPDRDGIKMYLYRLPAPTKPEPPKAQLTAAELDALWTDASSLNKLRQRQISAALAAAPGSAAPYLTKKVRVATASDVERIRKLIAELNADTPTARKAAEDQLATIAPRFEDVLRESLKTAPSGEIKNRLTFLLDDLPDKPLPSDLKAELRAIELLKMLNTAEAVKHLTDLAAGAPQSRITKEAKAVLGRAP